jgi:thymidylate kinase
VRQGFLEEARRRPEKIRVVDASPPVEKVRARILREVRECLGAASVGMTP